MSERQRRRWKLERACYEPWLRAREDADVAGYGIVTPCRAATRLRPPPPDRTREQTEGGAE